MGLSQAQSVTYTQALPSTPPITYASLAARSIAHRDRCVTKVDKPGVSHVRGQPIGELKADKAMNIPPWEFKYPIYNKFCADDNAEFYVDPPSRLGRRAQDSHLGKVYLALRGRSKKVGDIFNEAMSRSGIKQERLLCGRAFTVKVHGKTYFLALGNRLLCRDLGERMGVHWKLPERKQKGQLYLSALAIGSVA